MIAIKGDSKNGHNIINLFKMMGGKLSVLSYDDGCDENYYFTIIDGFIDGIHVNNSSLSNYDLTTYDNFICDLLDNWE